MHLGSKEDKYIYHLTSMKNLQSIVTNGLVPRNILKQHKMWFFDNADPEMLHKRNTDEKLLFHLTPYNTFDYQFRKSNPDWIYILLEKEKLKELEHIVIKNHPLNNGATIYGSFEEVNEEIDWDIMKHEYGKWYDAEKTIDISMIKLSEVQINSALHISMFNKFIVADYETALIASAILENIEREIHLNTFKN